MAAKVFQFPNPRNLGRRVGMRASEERVCGRLLEVAGGGDSQPGPHQWGRTHPRTKPTWVPGTRMGVGALSRPVSRFPLAFASPVSLFSHAVP